MKKNNRGFINLIVVIFIVIIFTIWIARNKSTDNSYVPIVEIPKINTQDIVKPSAVDFVTNVMHNKEELKYENWLSYFKDDSGLILKGINSSNYKDYINQFKLLDLSNCKILNPVDETMSSYYKKMKITWTDIVACEIIQNKIFIITLNYDSLASQYRIVNLGAADSMY